MIRDQFLIKFTLTKQHDPENPSTWAATLPLVPMNCKVDAIHWVCKIRLNWAIHDYGWKFDFQAAHLRVFKLAGEILMEEKKNTSRKVSKTYKVWIHLTSIDINDGIRFNNSGIYFTAWRFISVKFRRLRNGFFSPVPVSFFLDLQTIELFSALLATKVFLFSPLFSHYCHQVKLL